MVREEMTMSEIMIVMFQTVYKRECHTSDVLHCHDDEREECNTVYTEQCQTQYKEKVSSDQFRPVQIYHLFP